MIELGEHPPFSADAVVVVVVVVVVLLHSADTEGRRDDIEGSSSSTDPAVTRVLATTISRVGAPD